LTLISIGKVTSKIIITHTSTISTIVAETIVNYTIVSVIAVEALVIGFAKICI
jgi:hypothetical protein